MSTEPTKEKPYLILKEGGMGFQEFCNILDSTIILSTDPHLLESLRNKWVEKGNAEYVNKDEFNAKLRPLFANCDFSGCIIPSFEWPIDMFNHKLNFWGAIFTATENFRGIHFQKAAIFSLAEFRLGATFRSANFQEAAFFKKVFFKEEANFAGAKFNELVTFEHANFVKLALFNSVEFQKAVFFSDACFRSFISFENADFMRRVDFMQTKFFEEANFNNVQFALSANFDNVEFSDLPDFRFVSYKNSNFRFDTVKIDTVKNIIKKQTEQNTQTLPLSKMEHRFKALKELAIAGNDHKSELYFFGEEMDARRMASKEKIKYKKKVRKKKLPHISSHKLWRRLRHEKKNKVVIKLIISFFKKLGKRVASRFSLIGPYKWFSDYGRSFWRPLIWWIGMAVVVGLFLHISNDYNFLLKHTNYSLGIVNKFWITSITPFPYFNEDVSKGVFKGDICFFLTVGILLTISKIFSTIFLFLFGIGIRNEFRIKG